MYSSPARTPLLAAAVTAALLFGAIPAQADDACGWYAIAMCSSNRTSARDFVKAEGVGDVINTDDYFGLREGLYCVVLGPQSRKAALADRDQLRSDGISRSAYAKRACIIEGDD